jgi:tRNA G18 (ribose-2'-O)-methylase SpoU
MGLSAKQMKHCYNFINIHQYGGGTASLNVSIAASIVMQQLFQW